LVLRYEQQAAAHYGEKYIQHPAVELLNTMLNDWQRPGRNQLKGFYDYPDTGQRHLWSGLAAQWPAQRDGYEREELQERLLFVQVIEALWCMQEKIIESAAEANLGSIYGWGFPRQTGGVIRFIHDYGADNFIARAQVYQQHHGQRFRIPKVLREILAQPIFRSAKAAVE
ncbi:MAG: 3-hydroxybutyryl-CoA epimerase, partial [Bacteroidota bacterium]